MSDPDGLRWRDPQRRAAKRDRRFAAPGVGFKGRRTDLPVDFEEALNLSDYAGVFTEEWALKTLTEQHFWPLVEAATRVPHPAGQRGRPPLNGSWALFMCLFVLSREPSITRFYLTRTDEWWAAIGFDEPASKSALWDNLKRLERDCLGVFADASWFLIRRLDRKLDGLLLKDWWWDTTISLSPARWYHCCDDAECPKELEKRARAASKRAEKQPKRPVSKRRAARAAALPDDRDADDGQATSEARAYREAAADEDKKQPRKFTKPRSGVPTLPDRGTLITRLYGAEEAARDAANLAPSEQRRKTRSPLLLARDRLDAFRVELGLRPRELSSATHYAPLIQDYEGPGRFFSLKSTGCLYWTPDAEAAVRRKSDHNDLELVPGEAHLRYEAEGEAPKLCYDVSRLAPVSLPAPIGLLVKSAHESAMYAPLADDTLMRAAYPPRAVTVDAGGAVKPVAGFNARFGIANVTPSRGFGKAHDDRWKDDEHGRWDAFGIPRCKHCGRPARWVKCRPHRNASGEVRWRILFQCNGGKKPGCEQTQSLYLDEDPRILTTLWRDREVFHALLDARGARERVNGHEKQRWRIATDHHLVRRNRKGVRHQQLCGEVAMLLTWLQVSWLQGLVDGIRRIPEKITPIRATKKLERFKREYRKARLHLARPDFVTKRRAYEASRDRRRRPDADQLE